MGRSWESRRWGSQIGSSFIGAFNCFRSPPRVNGGVISGKQNLGYLPAAKFRGSGVMGIFQKPITEGLVPSRVRVSENTGNQAGDRVNDRYCGDRTVRQNVISDR